MPHTTRRASKLGLIADTHDNVPALEAALAVLQAQGVNCVIHAGDVTGSATLRRLEGWHAIVALGNNDTDEGLDAAARLAGVELTAVWKGALGGRSVAVVHGHDRRLLKEAIGSGRFDLIVTGHTHRLRDETLGRTRVVNPGALHRAARYTCAVYDTLTGALEVFEVPKPARGRP